MSYANRPPVVREFQRAWASSSIDLVNGRSLINSAIIANEEKNRRKWEKEQRMREIIREQELERKVLEDAEKAAREKKERMEKAKEEERMNQIRRERVLAEEEIKKQKDRIDEMRKEQKKETKKIRRERQALLDEVERLKKTTGGETLELLSVLIPYVVAKKKEEEKDDCCKICMDRKVDTILIPCGHAFCSLCAFMAKDDPKKGCHVCRGKIERINKIFF